MLAIFRDGDVRYISTAHVQGNHVCVENSMRQNCPVCFEYLFDSVRPTAVLPCGHTIHSECLKDMEKNRQLLCPICMKTYADLAPIWRRIDQEVADTPMPTDYANWVAHILCNDCNQVRPLLPGSLLCDTIQKGSRLMCKRSC